METTYDPIMGGPEPLPFLQLRGLAAPRLGLALVLVSSRGELVAFPGGSPVPAARFGNYRSAYYIDTAEHQLYLDAQLPSSDPGFVFQAHLTYRCRVTDPADVARRQIRDMRSLVAPRLVATMRGASRRLDIAESSRAEEAIEEALRSVSADPAVEITGCGIELPVHADEAASSGRSFRETHRETRLTGMKVGPMRELLAGGNPALLALHLASHPDDTGPVMEMIVAGDIAEARNMLQAISIMYGRSGPDDEPFETRDERKKLMDRFLTRALPTGALYGSGTAPDAGPRPGGSRLRGSLAGLADPARKVISAAVVSEDEAPPGRAPGPRGAPQPRASEPDRYLSGEMPSRIRAGRELSLILSITTKPPETSQTAAPLYGLFSGPEVVQLITLVVRHDTGLLTLGEQQQTVSVPRLGDSPPLRFAFQARAVGLSRVRVTAWLGGSFLAELLLEVSVESDDPAADIQRRSTPVGALRADPGEVTLQVHSDGLRYSFQLLSQQYLFGPVMAKSLTEEPGQAVERTVAMLRKIAAGASGYTNQLAARWVRETGTGLWQDLVPRVIQDQFWQLRDSITSFNVACEDDKVPWELLYPLTATNDAGFLVEQFPVVRRVYNQSRSNRVLLGDARYVVPPGSPQNARDEVAAIGRILGQSPSSVLTDLADLLRLLDADDIGLLHFACHNTFSPEAGGSSIKMGGGAFVPQLLNSAAARHCLAGRSPLIFINTCRSAGVSAEYTQMMGLASQFMAAGAGAFIGTLWPVRSLKASLFAEAFYSTLIAGADLGHATLIARQAAKDDADPTWLAYSVYGDPSALAA